MAWLSLRTGAHAYVAAGNHVVVIETANNTVMATVNVFGVPLWVAISPNGAFACVTNESSGPGWVIDTESNTVLTTINNLGNGAAGAAINPHNNFAYVANPIGLVSVINVATETVVATVNISSPGANPIGVAITPNGAFVYVANLDAPVSVISTATDTVVATAPVSGIALAIATCRESAEDDDKFESVDR